VFILTYCIAVEVKEISVSAPWRWRDNSTKTHRGYVECCAYKL